MVLEKLIEHENDTCDEEDDVCDISKAVVRRHHQKNKKEKKKISEFGMFLQRQLNQMQRQRQLQAKFDFANEQLNDSADTGTSNILAQLREELTDKEESRLGGLSSIQMSIAQLAAADSTDDQLGFNPKLGSMGRHASILKFNAARERILSDFQASDIENCWSNVEQSVRKFGGKLKFRGLDPTQTQGEETIGGITNFEEETTDLNEEFGNMFVAMLNN